MNLSKLLTDSKLMEEITARIRNGAYDPRYPIADREKAIDDINKLSTGESISIGHDIESVIIAIGRPALTIKKGSFQSPESDIWTSRLESSRKLIERAISSVGRIEVKNHPGFDWIGTGWIAKDNIVVTNRHVANEFATKDLPGKFRFRLNYQGKEIGSRIDFREEYLQPEEAEFKVIKVLHIEEDEGPDIALLEIEFNGDNIPDALKLADNINPDTYIAVIGYPAWDGRRNDPAVMRQIFGDIYDIKRLQPGQIVTINESYITHDCSTLGGNSGSPVIDLSTGDVVGLHFCGTYLKENCAVHASIVKDRINSL